MKQQNTSSSFGSLTGLHAATDDVGGLTHSFESLASLGKELFSGSFSLGSLNSNSFHAPPPQATASGMNQPTTSTSNNQPHTKGLWTPEQDDALRAAVAKHGAREWKAIAQEIPGGERTHIQCLQRWSKVLKPGLVKGSWTEDEDALLTFHVHQVERGNWVGVAKSIPGRTAKQCRERWMLVLDPTIRKDEWQPDEDELLLHLHQVHGNAWAMIAKHIPGRTENSTKSRFKSLQRKREKSWTANEDALILRMRTEDRTWEAIAERMPNRTKNACKVRWKELTAGHHSSSSASSSPATTTTGTPLPPPRRLAPPPPPPPLPPAHSTQQGWLASTMAAAPQTTPSLLANSESFDRWLKAPRFDLVPPSSSPSSADQAHTLHRFPSSSSSSRMIIDDDAALGSFTVRDEDFGADGDLDDFDRV